MSVRSGQELIDETPRTDLLLAHLGLISRLDGASAWYANRRLHVNVGSEACRDQFGQVALTTAITLALRTSIPVTVTLGDPDALLAVGSMDGKRLADAVMQIGARLGQAPEDAALIAIGESTMPQPSKEPQLQITWDGWIAGVRPVAIRLGERKGCVLAAIAAAALAVSEVFLHFIGDLDAAWRPLTLSLWDPHSKEPGTEPGTLVTRLPDKWMLIGLGHLGQAHAWCISMLPYRRGEGEVWLVDSDHASVANESTGVFTSRSDAEPIPRLKTRLVAEALEVSGLGTRMLEIRLPSSYRWEPGHPDVALIGVDNLEFRRGLSLVGWPLSVDGGLGSTPSSFSALSLHVFPGAQSSSDIRAWQNDRELPRIDQLSTAFASLAHDVTDQCGMVQLADKAVALPFVGVTAACLAVAEPLKRLHGGPGLDAFSLSLDSQFPRASRAEVTDAVRIGSVEAAPADLREWGK
jgi:hypothetical protein